MHSAISRCRCSGGENPPGVIVVSATTKASPVVVLSALVVVMLPAMSTLRMPSPGSWICGAHDSSPQLWLTAERNLCPGRPGAYRELALSSPCSIANSVAPARVETPVFA